MLFDSDFVYIQKEVLDMKTFIRCVAVAVLFTATTWGAMELMAAVSDFSGDIATARTLLDVGQIEPKKYSSFRVSACKGVPLAKYFYRQAAAEGLKREQIEGFCKNVRVMAIVVK